MIQYNKPYIRYSADTTFHGNYQLKGDLINQLTYNLGSTFYHNKKLSHVGCCTWVFYPTDMCEFFGLPEWLCVMYDKIFHYMTLEEAIQFYTKSIEVIRVGADLESARHKLAIWRLTDPEYGVCKYFCNTAMTDIVDLHEKALTETVSQKTWSMACGNLQKYASYRNSVFYESTMESVGDYAIDCAVKSCDAYYVISESLIDSINYAIWCINEFTSSEIEAKKIESDHYKREAAQLIEILLYT